MNSDRAFDWNYIDLTDDYFEEYVEAIENAINSELVGTTVRQLFAASDYFEVRALVAPRTKRPREQLRMLSPHEARGVDPIWFTYCEPTDEYIEALENTINSALVGTTFHQLFAKSDDPDLRYLVALSTRTPVEILIMLAGDEDENVRIAVAMNENASEEILIMLTHDEEEDVRAAVAGADTTADILRIMVDDDSDEVRACVAMNPNTDKQSRLLLAKDEDSVVRSQAACLLSVHGKSPEVIEALTILSTDIANTVRSNATHSLAHLMP